jgi:hypothetical protein
MDGYISPLRGIGGEGKEERRLPHWRAEEKKTEVRFSYFASTFVCSLFVSLHLRPLI